MSHLLRNIAVLTFSLAVLLGATACGGLMEKSTLPASSVTEMARVYFVFPGHSVMGYGAGDAYITEETTLIGYITNRQAFHIDVAPGKHLFMSVKSNTDAVEIDAAAGKTYYVKVNAAPNPIPMQSPLIYLGAILPGTEEWDKRNEWLEAVRYLQYNPEKGESWEQKYFEKNQERVDNYRSGKAHAKSMSADQGE